ncbi:MAG TPA: GNAT family N-acetyltransferase, partial [Micromonospora sp.]
MTDARDDLFDRLERFYDTLPRYGAHAETFGGLVLFVQRGAGWPYYARPRPDATVPPSAADIGAVRARQRELGLPESFEWVHENNPGLLAVARSAGLGVLEAPLMVLDPAALPDPADLCDLPVRLLDPDGPGLAAELAVHRAVAVVGFGAAGTATGPAGPAERDAAVAELTPDEVAEGQARMAAGDRYCAVAEDPAAGALAAGTAMRVDDTAE